MKLNQEIQKDISSRLNESLERIEACLDLINETELWWAPNAQCNSIGNQILHLEGNVRQYLISGLGGQQDVRKRNLEFSTKSGFSKEELLEKLKGTLKESLDIVSKLNEEQLLEVKKIQVYELNGLSILIHVTEHFSYHTGQIALLTKLIKNQDLGFYAGIDLG